MDAALYQGNPLQPEGECRLTGCGVRDCTCGGVSDEQRDLGRGTTHHLTDKERTIRVMATESVGRLY
jgi:hypothetical protein